ncbi:MAG TPA: adenylate/guanylate cyclase domain-containing protein [Acidimicrobiia bacterium]|nr:adenylate/guanylate cyclase domain-containing protein [Acidimicrobiia bacterium]
MTPSSSDTIDEPVTQKGAGLLTLLYADLEGSTPLVEQLGDDYPPLLHQYHTIVNAAISSHHGQTVSTEGDGFFCVFASPLDAVEAAYEIQSQIAGRTWPRATTPKCRIGIHTGTPSLTPQGYVGLDVHRGARVGAAAHGGQILTSDTTRILVEDDLGGRNWTMIDLGLFDMKGIGRSERLHRLDAPGLPLVLLPPRARPHNPSSVPLPPNPIVGRVADVDGAAQLLMRDSVRQVTITGPGGTGKTRLAIELATRLQPDFPDGVFFLDLSAVRAPAQFLSAVGRTLGIHESKDRSIVEALGSVVGPARTLLILDNMEQLISAGGEIGQILEVLPNARVLVTSRSPLRMSWEHEYPLSPLPVPLEAGDLEAISAADAVVLFVERAQAVRPDFHLDENNAGVIAEITRRLDGLPLGIELAAARLRLFSPDALLRRLDDRLSLLDRGPLDAPERHRTLRAAIQWSHDLLDEPEEVMFRRLGVFAGGWPLGAISAVCVDEALSERDAFDLLDELVAKSLVVFAIDDDGQPRYRMLETLREFSLEKLHESDEEPVLRRNHLRWCLSLATRLEDVLPTPEFPAALGEIERERHNIRESLESALRTQSDFEESLWICGLLPLYWDTRGYVTEGLELTTRLLEHAEGPSPGRAAALGTVGWLAMLAGDPDRSEKAQNESVEMWRALGDVHWLARSLGMHGMTTYNLNEIDRAEAQFNEAVDLARRVDFGWMADAWCVYGLAHVALARNDFITGDQLLRTTLEYSKSRGLTWGVGHAQLSLGVLAFMTGDVDQAVERLSESLLVRQQLKDARGICDCLGIMAVLASVRGDLALAAVLLGAAAVRRESSGHKAVPWQQPLLEEAAATARRGLGEDFDAEFARGRGLSTDQGIELALDSLTGPVKNQVPLTESVS